MGKDWAKPGSTTIRNTGAVAISTASMRNNLFTPVYRIKRGKKTRVILDPMVQARVDGVVHWTLAFDRGRRASRGGPDTISNRTHKPFWKLHGELFRYPRAAPTHLG